MTLFYRCIWLVAGLWLAAGAARAQPKPYRFDLNAEKLAVPASPWQVTQVLDLRPDRSRLGTVYRGLGNQPASADFTQPLATELLRFIQTQLPPQPGGRPVLLRVFALALGEDLRATSEHAEAEVLADFVEPQPDSTFRVVLSVGELTRRGGLDVTNFHPANVALALQQALVKLAAVPPSGPFPEVLSRAQVRAGQGGAAARRFPIQAAVPRSGIYRSLQEFLDNAPSAPERAFAITHVAHSGKRWAGTDEVQANYLYLDADHPAQAVSTEGIWGLSDGRECLIAYRNHFYKLQPTTGGRGYTFIGPPVYDAPAATNAALLGGLAGAGLASAATHMAPYELHLASGRVVPTEPVTNAGGFAQSDQAELYVYRRGGPAPAVALRAAGRPEVALLPRTYLALTWRDRRHELKLCLQPGTAAEACREFVPDFTQPTYFECVVLPGGAAELRQVTIREGVFQLQRAKEVK